MSPDSWNPGKLSIVSTQTDKLKHVCVKVRHLILIDPLKTIHLNYGILHANCLSCETNYDSF